MTTSSFGRHVQRFFTDYLTAQRDLSYHTVASYRDAVKLLLTFVSRRRHTPVADIGFDDLSPEVVLDFLTDLETTRGNTTKTRNVRLAALHSLFGYIAARDPTVLGTCQRICAIPFKRAQAAPVIYLDHDEVRHILGAIDRGTPLGRRDYLLMRLLFETGARAQEVASLHMNAVQLRDPPQVRILGKGRKERICPLRKRTAGLIRDHLRERRSVLPDATLFVSVRGHPLTRFGVLRIVQRRARAAAKSLPSLASKRIGVHTYRHSAAIHLQRAGNDLTVIRSWLGHVSVLTTDQYTDVDLDLKRRALEASAVTPVGRSPSWTKDRDLLTWLEGL